MTAVTTNKRPQRFFSSGSNLRFGGRQSTVTMGFHALAQSRLSPRFSSTRKNKSFLQYFATGSGTASYQDFEEYEFVECLSEETQIIYLFTNCNLQPHKLSQCTLATRLKSLGGGRKLWLSETEVQGKFTIGGRGRGRGRGFDLECVEVCHLGLSGDMLPRNIFNFKPSEMAANAFKTNMVW